MRLLQIHICARSRSRSGIFAQSARSRSTSSSRSTACLSCFTSTRLGCDQRYRFRGTARQTRDKSHQSASESARSAQCFDCRSVCKITAFSHLIPSADGEEHLIAERVLDHLLKEPAMIVEQIPDKPLKGAMSDSSAVLGDGLNKPFESFSSERRGMRSPRPAKPDRPPVDMGPSKHGSFRSTSSSGLPGFEHSIELIHDQTDGGVAQAIVSCGASFSSKNSASRSPYQRVSPLEDRTLLFLSRIFVEPRRAGHS